MPHQTALKARRQKRCAPCRTQRQRKRVQIDLPAAPLDPFAPVDKREASTTVLPSQKKGLSAKRHRQSPFAEPATCLNLERAASIAKLMRSAPSPDANVDLSIGTTSTEAPTALMLDRFIDSPTQEIVTKLDFMKASELACRMRRDAELDTGNHLLVFDGNLVDVELKTPLETPSSALNEQAIERANNARDELSAGAFAATHECWASYSPRQEHFLERIPSREVIYPTPTLLVSQETLTLRVATCMRSYALDFYSRYCQNLEVTFTERTGALVCRYLSPENSKRLKQIMQLASERDAIACAYLDAAVDSLPHISTTDVTPIR